MGEKISCLIVDDEPMALNLVESYVLKTPFLDLIKKCHSGIQALSYLDEEKVDLIFLDIQMPDLTGLQLAKVLPKSTRIIFTTAFDQYAIEGFKAEALDYLLKPFDYSEFLMAATKAKEWFELVKNQEKKAPETQDFLFVKSEYKQIKINLKDVLYFESLKDYVKIWLKAETKPILTLMSLKTLEEELSSDQFMRVHRSFIVALNNIDTIERSQILINNQRITISDQYRSRFLEFVSKNSLD